MIFYLFDKWTNEFGAMLKSAFFSMLLVRKSGILGRSKYILYRSFSIMHLRASGRLREFRVVFPNGTFSLTFRWAAKTKADPNSIGEAPDWIDNFNNPNRFEEPINALVSTASTYGLNKSLQPVSDKTHTNGALKSAIAIGGLLFLIVTLTLPFNQNFISEDSD